MLYSDRMLNLIPVAQNAKIARRRSSVPISNVRAALWSIFEHQQSHDVLSIGSNSGNPRDHRTSQQLAPSSFIIPHGSFGDLADANLGNDPLSRQSNNRFASARHQSSGVLS
jgi:hypothetical protein